MSRVKPFASISVRLYAATCILNKVCLADEITHQATQFQTRTCWAWPGCTFARASQICGAETQQVYGLVTLHSWAHAVQPQLLASQLLNSVSSSGR